MRPQRGFTRQVSIEDNTIVLRELIHKSKREGLSIAVVLLDLAKAFDTVSHEHIINALRWHKVHEHFIEIVRDLYNGGWTTFTTTEGTTDPIYITSGSLIQPTRIIPGLMTPTNLQAMKTPSY